ncbi:hypothetical protein IMAU30025_01746 [Lactobacillus helveticus]|uniref:AlwI family type II restriction endonuclease n=1 Tax=Lactobacillus helveticus TaxID=1587 RepID=UPI00156258C6|nr:AlwI family type II restriction endonuclease [Lactobacillus helveticus]NRO63049.1 hypothetical protein [Lactobacillus helveticus]
MSSFGERFLFFSTQPRNPIVIKRILKVVKKYNLDGKQYTKELQKEFYKDYTIESPNKGGNSKNKELAGRQLLTRAPQSLGFLQARTRKSLKITEAGKALLDDNLYEDVILHQMLKFQLPSPLHHESKKNKGFFNIKPFLELTRLINTLGYLTYKELTIYGMMLTNYRDFDKTVDSIRSYRMRRNAVKGVKDLREFDYAEQLRVFKDKYSDELAKGDYKTRESVTNTAEAYMSKKIDNWNDYADAIYRLLHESGLFVATGFRTMRISDKRQAEVDFILKNVSREPIPESTTREAFDQYMFNPMIPRLLNDDRNSLEHYLDSIRIEYKPDSSLYSLKKKVNVYRTQKRQEVVSQISNQLKKREASDINDILDTYKTIRKRGTRDAPTLMEWNTWRAVTMIDHGDIHGNFVTDDQGTPRHTAGGGKGDIVGNYSNFNIVYEVTMSTGKTQYNMESEPVTRHVGNLQKSSKMPAYGIFIAPKLNPEVIQYFYISTLTKSNTFGGRVGVVPLSLDDFITFYKGAAKKVLSEIDLKNLCDFSIKKAKESLMDDRTVEEWYKDVRNYVLALAK